LMIRSRDGQRFGVKAVEKLKERIDHSLEFAMLIERRSLLSDGIEFVEEQDDRSAPCEVKNFPQVCCRLSQIRRYHGVETNCRER